MRTNHICSSRRRNAGIRFLLSSILLLQLLLDGCQAFSCSCHGSILARQALVYTTRRHSQNTDKDYQRDCAGHLEVSPYSPPQPLDRRQMLHCAVRMGLSAAVPLFAAPAPTPAAESNTSVIKDATAFIRRTKEYAYQFTPPGSFVPGNKPLKTHLDEVNFKSSNVAGYQFGLTVDPVRISSLPEFGTAEQVAAKVVTAEVNRDGVFDVKLMQDPATDAITGALILDYLSTGKRGEKRNVVKFFVAKNKLYTLTAVCKQADYETVKAELLGAVDSYRLLD